MLLACSRVTFLKPSLMYKSPEAHLLAGVCGVDDGAFDGLDLVQVQGQCAQ